MYKRQDLERAMSLRYRKSFLGKECCILLEDEVTLEGRQYYIGHTPEYVRMAVPKEEGGIKKGMFVLGTAITMLDDEVVLLQEKLRQ